MTKYEKIRSFIDKLGLTREEAEQLYKDDNSSETLPSVAEMEKKAKDGKRRYETTGKTRQTTPKEKKIDSEKVFLIDLLAKALSNDSNTNNLTIANSQREITLKYGDNEYSVTLVKHRPVKQ